MTGPIRRRTRAREISHAGSCPVSTCGVLATRESSARHCASLCGRRERGQSGRAFEFAARPRSRARSRIARRSTPEAAVRDIQMDCLAQLGPAPHGETSTGNVLRNGDARSCMFLLRTCRAKVRDQRSDRARQGSIRTANTGGFVKASTIASASTSTRETQLAEQPQADSRPPPGNPGQSHSRWCQPAAHHGAGGGPEGQREPRRPRRAMVFGKLVLALKKTREVLHRRIVAAVPGPRKLDEGAARGPRRAALQQRPRPGRHARRRQTSSRPYRKKEIADIGRSARVPARAARRPAAGQRSAACTRRQGAVP
jgi:hypothetical protein